MVSPFTQPDYTSDNGSEYPTNIDNAVSVLKRHGAAFAPRAQNTPNMTIHIEAGYIFSGGTLTEVAAQDTGTISAPSTNPRIDRVVYDSSAGSVSVVTGSEAASPSAPAIPNGKVPIAQISLTTSQTEIVNADISDERALATGGVSADIIEAIRNDIFRLYFEQSVQAGDRLNMAAGISDPFADESDIDTASSANEDYDASGDFYSPTSTGSASEDNGNTVSFVGGSDITHVPRDFSINNSDTIQALGFYSEAAISGKLKIVKRNSAGNYDIIVDQAVSHTGSGWEEFDLTTPYNVPASGEYHVGWYSASNYEMTGTQARAYVVSSDVTGTGVTFTEDSGVTAPVRVVYQQDISDLDLQSTAFTASAAPGTARLVLYVSGDDADTLTLNTDLIGLVSRDDGDNWTSATLEVAGELSDGTKLFVDNEIDISGQPVDTDMKWRVQTANGVAVEIHGVILQWEE